MKWIALIILGLLFSLPSRSQELAGIINQYTAVTGLDACAGSLVLADTSGFAPGTDVILVQMQGATIQTNDNSAFGDLIDLGSAGLYERQTIASRNGNTVVLAHALLHDYDPIGRLQLVSLPVFDEATVTAPLQAAPWNGTTGGVLALEVTGTLTLQADLDASDRGFRGGLSQINDENDCSFLQNIDNWYFNLNNWRGAPKGEGAAAFTSGREAGRGAQLNGGGGGNDHNSGGGGGANITSGGQGGDNEEPSFFGCDGQFPGRGGKALPADSTRLYLGGGGGAGHENNGVGTDGGHGGGIIILSAGTINGNGFAIRSNGAEATDGGGDGGGGGGGGGTLLLQAQAIDNLTIEARGGDGADINNNNQDRCHGPGGGGSGGRLLSNLVLNADLSGGNAGQSLNSSAGGCNGSNNAAPGQDGLSTPLFQLPTGTVPNEPLAVIDQPATVPACDGQSLSITVTTTGAVSAYQWQVDTGAGFTDLSDNAVYAGAQSPTLTIDPVNSQIAGYSFRLQLSNDCGDLVLSDPIGIALTPLPTAGFSYTVFGLAVQFQNSSSDATSYLWDFGDNQTSTSSNPIYGYAGTGNFPVTLIAANACGADTITMIVQVTNAPTAAFEALSPTTGCAPLTVDFFNISTNATSFEWLFPGGSPASSNDLDAGTTYTTAGVYDVTLIAYNGFSYDTLTMEQLVSVSDVPVPAFSFSVNGAVVTFTNTTAGADAYLWDFGDNQTSTASNPSHTYANDGSFTVTLTAENECGTASVSQTVTLNLLPTAAFETDVAAGCAPLTVNFTNNSTGADSYLWLFPGGDPAFSTISDPTVSYNTAGLYDITLIVSNPAGADTLTLEDYLSINQTPLANFESNLSNLTVSFTNTSLYGDSFQWDFGDAMTSNQTNPVHTYDTPGIYLVSLTVENECGADTYTTNVVVGMPPQAAFSASPLSGCAPVTVQFTDQSGGLIQTYSWLFPGGTPALSSDPNPVVTYDQPGQYDVTLTINGPIGNDTRVQEDLVNVYDFPLPDFDYTIDGLTVIFTNLSAGATDYFWDFGDGNTSLEANPVHTYATAGYYQVTLNALTPACGNAGSQDLAVGLTATNAPSWRDHLRIFPNPARESLLIAWENGAGPTLDIRLFSAAGRVLQRQQLIPGQNTRLEVHALPEGLYFLELTGDAGRWVEKVVVSRR